MKILTEARNGFYNAYASKLVTKRGITVVKKYIIASVSIRDNKIKVFLNGQSIVEMVNGTVFFKDKPVITLTDGVSDHPDLNYLLWKIDELQLLQD